MAVLASIVDVVRNTAVLSRNPHPARPNLPNAASAPPFEHLDAPGLEKLLAEAKTAKHVDTVRRINEELYRRHQCYRERLKAIDQTPLTNTHTSIAKLRDHRRTGTLSKEQVAARSTPEPKADSGPVEGAGEFAARGGRVEIIEPKKAPVKRGPRLKQAIGHTDALDVKGNIRGNFRSAGAVRAVSKISETKDPLNADLDTENPEDGPSAPKPLAACTTASNEVVKVLLNTMNESEREYVLAMISLTKEAELMLNRGENLPKRFKGRDAQVPGIPDDKLVAEKLGVSSKTITRRKCEIILKYGPTVFKTLGYK